MSATPTYELLRPALLAKLANGTPERDLAALLIERFGLDSAIAELYVRQAKTGVREFV